MNTALPHVDYQTLQVLMWIAFSAVLLPIIHAIRSEDGLAVLGAIAATVAAIALSVMDDRIWGQMSGILVWCAAYVAAAVADHARSPERAAEKRRRNEARMAAKAQKEQRPNSPDAPRLFTDEGRK